jgi:hypothetical protein
MRITFSLEEKSVKLTRQNLDLKLENDSMKEELEELRNWKK